MVPASPTSATPTRSRSEIPDSRAVSSCRSAASASTSASSRGQAGSGAVDLGVMKQRLHRVVETTRCGAAAERIATTVSTRPAAATA